MESLRFTDVSVKVFEWNGHLDYWWNPLGAACVSFSLLWDGWSYIRIKNALFVFSNRSQMLPPAAARSHSARLPPMRAGLNSSLLPAESRRLTGAEESSPPSCCSSQCSAAPPWTEGTCWLCVRSGWAAVCVWCQPSSGLICFRSALWAEIWSWQRATMKPPECCPCPNPSTSTTPSSLSST